jgi:hypothetical protein
MTTLIAGSSEATDEREVLTLISLYGARVSLGLRSAAPPSERGKGATIPQLHRGADLEERRRLRSPTPGDSLCGPPAVHGAERNGSLSAVRACESNARDGLTTARLPSTSRGY